MSIKMIVLDLDGTFLRDDKTVSEKSISVLKRLRARGIKTVFATVRGVSAQNIVPCDLFDGFVRMCGAEALADDIKVYKRYISTKKVKSFLSILDEAGIRITVESKGSHYANFNVNDIWDWVICFSDTDFPTLDIEAEKLIAFPNTIYDIDFIKKNIPEDLNIIITRDSLVMMMNKDATKAKAISALASYWTINRHEIVSFGDDITDIDLLKYSGIGVAMGNALDEVKSIANFVCDTNENDGVAKWLEDNL